jgi:hypothetical protein
LYALENSFPRSALERKMATLRVAWAA